MRRAQEDDGVAGYKDGAKVFMVMSANVVGVQQGPLGDNSTQAVRNPDNGKLPGALACAVLGKGRDQALGVHVDEVVAGT